MKAIPQRDRLMLAGMFLSKFDREGLLHLGFASFSEAFNAMGYALAGKPASIKNYMQEFDPLFPNSRKGWHKRPLRDHCRKAFERFGQIPLVEFYHLLTPLLLPSALPLPDGMEEIAMLDDDNLANESFSRRLITGAAAEGFFESAFPKLAEFADHTLTNVTRFGCGFDFRVMSANSEPFLAVEVKGMANATGDIMMTSKEYRVAKYLQNRYFLCVVSNFIESPILSIFQNPVQKGIELVKRERVQSMVTWHARISA
ncbi:MAG: DUF3883 domain-containing protein [Verrucomicrobiota bacterium]